MNVNAGAKVLFKCVGISLWLLSSLADSITPSITSTVYTFDATGAYANTAAHYQHPPAMYYLYKSEGHKDYLYQAAKLDYPPAVIHWYQIVKKEGLEGLNLWRQRAIQFGSAEVVLDELNALVAQRNWQAASVLLSEHAQLESQLPETLSGQFKQLVATVQFDSQGQSSSLLPAPESLTALEFVDDAKCRMVVAMKLQDAGLHGKAQSLVEQFKSSRLATLPICWQPPVVEPLVARACNASGEALIDCDMQLLASSFAKSIESQSSKLAKATHLIVLTNEGGANTRGGLMLLAEGDSFAVFIHELAHWLDYFDEYQISPAQQQRLCRTKGYKRLGKNLIIANKALSRAEVQDEVGIVLFPTNTCNGTEVQAYKVFPQPSFMEYLDTEMSLRYANHILQNFEPNKIVPVAMNFALAYQYHDYDQLNAFDQEHWRNRSHYWLALAAEQGFPPAMRLLSQLWKRQGLWHQAHTILVKAANMGDSTSQVLLGHSYLEGTWLERDLEQSAVWYRKAALAKDPYGLYFYGKCFEMGWGCPKSSDVANLWFSRAAKRGSELAIDKLKAQKSVAP